MTDYSNAGFVGPHKNIRTKDAAAIILFDRSDNDLRVLVGKRSTKHAFMPDVFVFPGGKRDATDYRLPFGVDLSGETHGALAKTMNQRRASAASTRSFALAALRELHEETGINCWEPRKSQPLPNLAPLRFVARAITPPGHIRRYDTRFFSAFSDELDINPTMVGDSDELQEIQWLSVSRKSSVNMPAITQLVLEEAIATMTQQQQSATQAPVAHFSVRNKRFIRRLL
jgi:8-oxo-dGTP pyrophosphatase MutT (NUDIX family)